MTARPTHDSRPRRPRPRAFTLMELIAIMVVMALLAGAAVPTLSSISASRGAAAARQLLRDLTFARQRALATGTRCWVVCGLNSNSWSVMSENPASPGRAGATIISDLATGRPYTTNLGTGSYVGIAFVSAGFDGQPEVGFDLLGRPINSSEAALSVDGAAAFSGGHAVTVARGTGLARYVAP